MIYQMISLSLVVPKAFAVPGLSVTKRELDKLYHSGAKVKIFCPSNLEEPAVKDYLELMSADRKAANLTFSKRPFWYWPLDGKEADAFLSGMSHLAPRIIINDDGVPCTNSLYRLNFKRNLSSRRRKLLALTMLSSPSQLSAELTGRAYAAGMLKHEPSDAARILLLVPQERDLGSSVARTFALADTLLKSGQQR